MAEFLSEGYEELEQDAIEASVSRFKAKVEREEFINEDPRIAASEAIAYQNGFVMQEGQYIDVLNIQA